MKVPNDSTIIIDKPLRWSSFDVLRYLKRMYRQNTPKSEQLKKFKIGHAGTLDPLATGVLIVCTGKNTKLINTFQNQTKEYIATVNLGGTTPSYDSEFPPENYSDPTHLTLHDIENILPEFTGTIQQIPPAYSALRINGKRAYELARETDTKVEIKPREITIDSIELVPDSFTKVLINEREYVQVKLVITCSKGTYIRSIAHDIGAKLNVGGYLGGLIRSRIGDFMLDQAHTLNDVDDFVPSTDRDFTKQK